MPTFFFHVVFDLSNNSDKPPGFTPASADIFYTPHQKTGQHRTRDVEHNTQKRHSTCQEAVKSRTESVFNTTSTSSDSSLKESKRSEYCEELIRIKSSEHGGFNEWRYGNVSLQRINMIPTTSSEGHGRTKLNGHIANGIGAGSNGLATKGRYEPTSLEEDVLGWGIVRLYRDTEETPGLYEGVNAPRSSKNGRGFSGFGGMGEGPTFRDEDCTTLCILAVPSYLTPSDFLGFVGERTREEVSHFRMIRTERVNRYMVLMKFRNGKKAREWRKEWDGKVFNSTEVRVF